MGEISEAMERAREVARREQEAAAAARTRPQPVPSADGDPDGAQEIAAGEGAGSGTAGAPGPARPGPERLPARELSLDDVRAGFTPRSHSVSRGAARVETPAAVERPSRLFPISRAQDDHWRARATIASPESTCAVRFPHLAVRVRAALDQASSPSLLVTSAVKGEGKTTVSTNLALALASIDSERSVALVDLDLRSASVGLVLGLAPPRGIDDVLEGRCGLDDVRIATDVGALDVYPVARPRRDAHGLLGRSAERVLRELLDRYDYVIADGPPVLPVPDTPMLAPLVGGCLVVVRSRRTRRSALRELMELMPRATLLGVFLNDAPDRRDIDAYGYYGRAPGADHAGAAPVDGTGVGKVSR